MVQPHPSSPDHPPGQAGNLPTTRRGTSMVLLLVLLLTAACTSGGAAASAPEDFTVHDREAFGIATPPGWSPEIDGPDRLLVFGEAMVGDMIEAVDVKVGNVAGDFDAAVLGITDPFRIGVVDDYEVLEERDADVAGADEARFVDGTYTDSHGGERTRQWDLFATVGGATQLVYVSLKAPEQVFDEAVMQQILDSLEVRL